MRGTGTSKVALLCCLPLCLFFAFALLVETTDLKACLENRRAKMKSSVQGPWQAREADPAAAAAAAATTTTTTEGERRNLMGPGSYPPRCTSKCGECSPCRPVHVPVPPGSSAVVAAEYYPEAWRCKCGNRLFML